MGASEKLAKYVMMVLVASLLVILGSGVLLAYAQGGGPADAIDTAQGWTPIGVGQSVWYAFGYTGDKSQIQIRMPASPRSAVAFSVWTPAEVAAWARDGKENPIGRGSPNSYMGNDLVWSGNFTTKGTYYVRVEQKGTAGGSYDMQITGKDVYFPAGPVTQAAAAQAAPAAQPVAQLASVSAPAATQTGSGPADALKVDTQWTALTAGQRNWYAFQYKGDKSQILIRLAADPKSSVAFSVWTPGDVAAWGRDGKENPVGRGSANSYLGNDLVWSGNFPVRGTYYVRVEQKGAAAGNYSLQVSGKGVTF